MASCFSLPQEVEGRAKDRSSRTDENCEDVRSCGCSWSWSEATYEHKAFTYWAPENLLAVPLSTYRYVYDEVNHYYNYEYVSMLKLINVDAENLTLSEHGEVDHSPFYNNEDSEMNWWYSYSTNIRRSIFMGDYVYAFSALGVTVHRTTDLVQMENIEIPGHEMPGSVLFEAMRVTVLIALATPLVARMKAQWPTPTRCQALSSPSSLTPKASQPADAQGGNVWSSDSLTATMLSDSTRFIVDFQINERREVDGG